jgi:hypothetical protein
VTNIKKLMRKFVTDNKAKVLRAYLMEHTVKVTNQDGLHRLLQRRMETAQSCTAAPLQLPEGR